MTPATPIRAATPAKGDATRRAIGLSVLFAALLLPVDWEVAGLRLTPLRIVLLALVPPFVIGLLSGRAGRVTGTDIAVVAFAGWIALALTVTHGLGRAGYAGITGVELLGGYLAGRMLIRGAEDYRRMLRMMVWTMALLLPAALIEFTTGRMVIPDLMRHLGESTTRGASAYGRLGFERVFSVFEHPIHFGLFCALGIANFAALSRGRAAAVGLAGAMTFLSLSTAPLLAAAAQAALLLWGLITGGAWRALALLAAAAYVTVDLLSNRTPVTILIDTLTFNPVTGWVRLAVFEAGMASVRANPVFGIGFNDWPRPGWVTASVDNFWLLTAMRYGVAAALLAALAFGLHAWRAARAPLGGAAAALRTGHLIGLVALCVSMLTVHIWGAMGVFAMLYLGAGAWTYAGSGEAPEPDRDEDVIGRLPRRYTRFAPSATERAW